MNASIQLQNQALKRTAEVHHASSHRVLTAEAKTRGPKFTEQLPGDLFRFGRRLAQLPGVSNLGGAAGG
ncbi:MAG TPA: hypothetical protein VKM93_17955 [Terriglobia bacterium]|nr:hypothetical protein [Terriglobia bacterium]